jgi:DNA-binding NarL/FixJ family response regulator
MNSESITLLIVEDHELTRIGLRLTLDSMGEFTILGEAEDGASAVAAVTDSHPDVVLMDIGLPKLNGIEATKQIKEYHPGTKIIMLTSHCNDDDVFASFSAGADGYCLKDVKSAQLQLAIRTTASGASWLDPGIASRVFQSLPKEGNDKDAFKKPSAGTVVGQPLSERERQVVEHVANGLSNQEIADRLFVSVETVKTHMRRIMDKLAVSDRTQAAVKAMKQGILT